MDKKKILTALFASIITLSVIGATYAYFTATAESTPQTVTLETGTMALTFSDNDNGVGGVLDFDDSITKRFTIENTGTVDTYAKISWLNITNSYLEGSLVYTLQFSEEENGYYQNFITEKNVPTNVTKGTEVLANGVLVPAGTKMYYNLVITLINSKKMDQTDDFDATFWSQFTLESGSPAANEVLASLGLEDSIKVEPSTYNMFSFTTSGYNGNTSYAGQSTCLYNGHVAQSMTGEVSSETCNDVYYINLMGREYYYDSSFEMYSVGKSEWDSNTNMCLVNENQVFFSETFEPATEEQCGQEAYEILKGAYFIGAQKLGKGSRVEISTNEGLYVMEDDFGLSYYYRGTKSLNNIVKFGTYNTDMYYYPYAKSDGTNPYTTGNLAQCQSESSNASTYCSSTYKYARAGDSMYWRIVRINGDGTLRLMYMGTGPTASVIYSYAGDSYFNYNYDDPKYTGYTYDNSSPNVQDGTPSDIKNYLDTWFERSLSDETGKIATSQFYSDTTDYIKDERFGENAYSYAAINRLVIGAANTISPTLKTKSTTETYGGMYYLKVGLLNADELVLSGYDGSDGSAGYSKDGTLYPYTMNTSRSLWTLSPSDFSDGYALVFRLYNNGHVTNNYVNNTNGVAPVISLTTEYSKQLRGLGTKDVPFTLE